MKNSYAKFDRYDTPLSAIAKWAQWTPDKVFIEEIGRDTLTFSQFDLMIRRWGDALRRHGVAEGDRVATMVQPSTEAAVSWLSSALIRALEVPINTDYRSDMLYYMLKDSGAKLLITTKRYVDRFDEITSRAPELQTVVVLDDESSGLQLGVKTINGQAFLSGAEPLEGLEPPKTWDVMGIMYTGGTTGPSKGVILPWGSQRKSAETLPHIGPDDAFYAPFALYHGTARVPLAMMAFAGGRDVIREKFNTEAFWEDVDTHRCTITTILPAMGRWLLNRPASADDRNHTLREVVMQAGAKQFKERFGVTVHGLYGQTESGNAIMHHDVHDKWDSCGTLRPGFQVRLVDEHDYDVPVGEVGQLLVRTDEPWIVNLGYFGKPEQTVEAWRNGWIHTGDAMRQDGDGYYYFVDRVRDYIRRRGENISSFEIEAQVMGHPGVAEAAAIAVPSEHGEDEVKIVVVRKSGVDISAEELIMDLIPVMPRFMVPRYVEFVETLPRTVASGQVRKVELRAEPLNANTWDREAAGIVVPR